MTKEDEPIIVEQTFARPVEAVWKAVTEVDRMRQWYFAPIPAFRAEVGFEVQFTVQSQDRVFLHQWRVIKVEPLKLISYTWKYDGYPGDSFVVFELFKKNGSTMLRLTHQVMESFPQDIPEFLRESGIKGWNYFIGESLRTFLEEGKP